MTAEVTIKPLGVGFVLHPDKRFLASCRSIIEEDADFYEMAPETLWQADAQGRMQPTGWTDVFADIKSRSARPFVGHGLGLSPGTASTDRLDRDRLDNWIARIERDQEIFEFLWYTEHLGWVSASGLETLLPIPLPPTEESAQIVAQRLGRLKGTIPLVGFENQVSFFAFADVREEAPFWNRICELGDLWLLLDLHNAWTQCQNFGAHLDDYLSRLDLSRVLEIHLSGGYDSDPSWLSSGRVMRLDSHDGPVPDPVWQAFRDIRPRCPNLRGVVVERMNVNESNIELFGEEVRRARRMFWE